MNQNQLSRSRQCLGHTSTFNTLHTIILDCCCSNFCLLQRGRIEPETIGSRRSSSSWYWPNSMRLASPWQDWANVGDESKRVKNGQQVEERSVTGVVEPGPDRDGVVWKTKIVLILVLNHCSTGKNCISGRFLNAISIARCIALRGQHSCAIKRLVVLVQSEVSVAVFKFSNSGATNQCD